MISIYRIYNSCNKKVYIGQTKNTIQRRFCQHKKPQSVCCPKLWNAFNKYGRENFKIELITFCHTQDVADQLESYFINLYNSIKNGYNIKGGGISGSHSENTKKKISETAKQKASGLHAPFYGKKHTVESKLKFSGKNHPRYGKHLTDEQMEKLKIGYEKYQSDVKSGVRKRKSPVFSEEAKIKMKSMNPKPISKLTWDDVIHIRSLYNNGNGTIATHIAKQFPQVHENTIFRICAGTTWKIKE